VDRDNQAGSPLLDPRIDSLLQDLDAGAVSRLTAFVALLTKWNRRVNLVSSTESRILYPLLGEALWAAGMYPADSHSHLDIGSGAGFPAVPLAIVRPGTRFTLLEARSKRAAFLETAAHELNLGNVSVVCNRLERYLQTMTSPGPWRRISWKGLKLERKELSQLLRLSAEEARLWVFHGTDLPMDRQQAQEMLSLRWREPCPHHAGWFLSEYGRRPVSRETT
jgi:16S rRNA (guanine(527)-N(7))-methyltransferase RsmG